MREYRESPRRTLYPLLAALLMLAGCLEGKKPPIDSGCLDCDRFLEDPCADGGCIDPDPDPPFLLGEGGEIRLERFQDSADGSEQTLAAQAFFFTGQNPPARAFNDGWLSLRAELSDQGYFCHDLRDGAFFDNGKTQEAQDIADTREYYDVGANVTLTSTSEPTDFVRMDKFLRAEDPAGATDLSSGLQHAVLYKGNPARQIRHNTTFRPSITGSPSYPALDLKWGMSVDGEERADPQTGEGTPEIYMPSEFTLTSPTEAEFFTPGFLTFTRGEDLTIRYTSAPRPAGWPVILPYASFVDGEGRVRATCVKVDGDSAADDGTFIVPFEVLAIVEPAGRLVFGRLAHVAWEYPQDRSRVDLIGMESKRAPYTLVDAPPALRARP